MSSFSNWTGIVDEKVITDKCYEELGGEVDDWGCLQTSIERVGDGIVKIYWCYWMMLVFVEDRKIPEYGVV